MARACDPDKMRQWRARLGRFSQRTGTIAAFCRKEGVSTAAFYLWRQRLRAEPAKTAAEAPAAFRPVHLVARASVLVRLPGGTKVRVPGGDLQALTAVLEIVALADGRQRDARQAGVPSRLQAPADGSRPTRTGAASC